MISEYKHPYVTVDAVILRFAREGLEVLLLKRDDNNKVALPGGFMDIDKTLEETLTAKVSQKTNLSRFYFEQLKTFDSINRDERERIVSIAYLCLVNKLDGSKLPNNVRWCPVHANLLSKDVPKIMWLKTEVPFHELAFDHGEILTEALRRLKNKIWYSDLAGYLLPKEFTTTQVKALWGCVEGRPVQNPSRIVDSRTVPTGEMISTGGRPAIALNWNWKRNKGDI